MYWLVGSASRHNLRNIVAVVFAPPVADRFAGADSACNMVLCLHRGYVGFRGSFGRNAYGLFVCKLA